MKNIKQRGFIIEEIFILSGTALLLLSACNNGDSSSDSKGASKVEDTQKSDDSKKGTILSHHQAKKVQTNQASLNNHLRMIFRIYLKRKE